MPIIGASERDLNSIRVPACIIPGNDKTHSHATAEAAHRMIPGSELHDLFPGDLDVDLVPPEDLAHKEAEMAAVFDELLASCGRHKPRSLGAVRGVARAPRERRLLRQGIGMGRLRHGMEAKSMVKACGLTLRRCSPPALPQQPSRLSRTFPTAPGKDTFLAICGGCHDINRSRAGYTPQGWRTVMHMMQSTSMAPVPQDQIGTLTEYLIKSFPERPRPPAVIIDGPRAGLGQAVAGADAGLAAA